MYKSLLTVITLLATATPANSDHLVADYRDRRAASCGTLQDEQYCECVKKIWNQITEEGRDEIYEYPSREEEITADISLITQGPDYRCFVR